MGLKEINRAQEKNGPYIIATEPSGSHLAESEWASKCLDTHPLSG